MTDWIMVVITTIYVIATVIMCYLNYKTFELTKQQISDSLKQRQINEMPYLQVKLVEGDKKSNGSDYIMLFNGEISNNTTIRNCFSFVITNMGRGIAKNVTYDWEHKKQSPNHIIRSFTVNEYRVINVEFVASLVLLNDRSPTMTIRFTDIYDIMYEQKLYFHLDIVNNKIVLINTSVTAPVVMNKETEHIFK